MTLLEKIGITPGPWEIKTDHGFVEKIGPIDIDYEQGSGAWFVIKPEDARLIAQAPEMFALLCVVVENWENYPPDFVEDCQRTIELATGKTVGGNCRDDGGIGMSNEIKQEIPCPQCGRTDYYFQPWPTGYTVQNIYHAVTSCCHVRVDVRVTETQTPTTR